EHWQRFTTTMHHREHPAWYFVPILAAGVFPWLLPVVAGWARAARAVRGGGSFSSELFLGLWALVVLLFFSVSHSKLPPYILPMFPALAALTGAYLAEEPRRGLLWAQCLLVAGAGVILALGGGRLEGVVDRYPGFEAFAAAYRPWLAAAAASL